MNSVCVISYCKSLSELIEDKKWRQRRYVRRWQHTFGVREGDDGRDRGCGEGNLKVVLWVQDGPIAATHEEIQLPLHLTEIY